MSGFLNILRFELRVTFFKPIYLFAAGLFLHFGLLTMAGAAGLFGEGSSAIGAANSMYAIFSYAGFFNKFFFLLAAVLSGMILAKDFRHHVGALLYSYPVQSHSYVIAKWLAVFLLCLFLVIVFYLGLIAGTLLPGIDATAVLPFEPDRYLTVFALFTLPNLVIVSVFIFSVVLISRNAYSGFLALVLLLLLREGISRIAGGGDPGFWFVLADPLGETLINYATSGWTPMQQATQTLPVNKWLLANRIFWLLVAFAFGLRQVLAFNMSPDASGRFGNSKKPKRASDSKPDLQWTGQISAIDRLSIWSHIRNAFFMAKLMLASTVKRTSFIALVILILVFVGALLMQVNPSADTRVMPMTWYVLGLPMLFLSLIINGLTILYAGIFTHEARNYNMAGLENSTSAPDWVFGLSRIIALVGLQWLILSLTFIAAILVQWYSGVYAINVGQYLFAFLLIHFPGFIIWSAAALFIHTLFDRFYPALLILVLAAFAISVLPQMGLESFLLRFNETPVDGFYLKYSDLSGYGHSLGVFWAYKVHWILVAMVLLVLTLALLIRWQTETFRERVTLAFQTFERRSWMAFAGLILLTGLYASVVHQAEQKEAEQQAFINGNIEEVFAERFGHLQDIPQPVITAVDLNLDLYPQKKTFTANGNMRVRNTSKDAMVEIRLTTGFDEVTTISPAESYNVHVVDADFKMVRLQLHQPLLPGDSLSIAFTIQSLTNTWLIRNTNVLNNGTILKNDIMPVLGFPLYRLRKNDNSGINRDFHYQARHAHKIYYTFTIGTSQDQQAIAPGMLQRRWLAGDRVYFQYRTLRPIKPVFALLSGDYVIATKEHNNKLVQIYHHPDHHFNNASIFAAVEASLALNNEFFGPFAYDTIKIVEFPRTEGSYATLMGNIIPLSEQRFVADSRKTEAGYHDLAFYAVAHELTHYWWGQQLLPANGPGAHFLTESITEYLTAMIYRDYFGDDLAEAFIRLQRKRYLLGRKQQKTEKALAEVGPEDAHIAYGKGAFVLDRFARKIGHQAFAGYLASFRSRHLSGPPYPIVADFIDAMALELSPENHALLTEQLLDVIFYDFAIENARVTSLKRGGFSVKMELKIEKSSHSSKEIGQKKPPLPGEEVTIRFVDNAEQPVAAFKVPLSRKNLTLDFQVDKQPAGVIIDPEMAYLETELNDNRLRF
jgi:ABC-2 type transport system permease protein